MKIDEKELLRISVDILKKGGLIAVPFDTVYGLMTPALDANSLNRLIKLKGRDIEKPIPVVIPSKLFLNKLVVKVEPLASFFMEKYWPGALTIVLRAKSDLPLFLTKDGFIGVRIPKESPAEKILKTYNGILTATSANISGRKVAKSSDEIKEVWGEKIDFVWPGEIESEIPSTVIKIENNNVTIIREGVIPAQEIFNLEEEFKRRHKK